MNNKFNKLTIGITVLFEIILTITIIYNILLKHWNKLGVPLFALVCIIFPFIITHIANVKNLILPSSFKLSLLLFIILSLYFGEIMEFYTMFWWWDLFLHGIFGSYAAITAIYLLNGVFEKKRDITKKQFKSFLIISAFNFSITLGTLWEMFEFLSDYFLKTDLVNGGLEDTATDLLIKILFAFITCLIYYNKSTNKI